jgi:hypothetical protein
MTPILGVSISDAEICSTLGGKLNLDDGDRQTISDPVKVGHEWFVVDQNIDRDALTFN